jgi:hypothetical protein
MLVRRLRSTSVVLTLTGALLAVVSSACSNRPIDPDGADSGAPPADVPGPAAAPDAEAPDLVVTPAAEDAQAPQTDAAVVPAPDGPSPGTARVTYVADIQPILRATCASCHTVGAPSPEASSVPFVDSYAATQALSKATGFYGCPGELVGACINRGAQIQELEGTRCRTFDRPFHRDGFDRCITDEERALINTWVETGMAER